MRHRIISGEGHQDLFRLLHAVMHGTEALIYINHSKEAAAASTCLPVVYPDSSAQQWYQYSSRISALTDVGRGRLETTCNRVFDIMSLTSVDV